jgi:hypothetical protein
VAALSPLPIGRQRAVVPHAGRYRNVRPSRFKPALLVGRIVPGRSGGGRVVAVATNGSVAATGRTFTLARSGDEQFSVLIPERALRRGFNRLELLLVNGRRVQRL